MNEILQSFHAKRKEPKHAVETFANKVLGPEVETADEVGEGFVDNGIGLGNLARIAGAVGR